VASLFSPAILEVLNGSTYSMLTKKNFIQLLQMLATALKIETDITFLTMQNDAWNSEYINRPRPAITLEEIRHKLDTAGMIQSGIEYVLMRLFLELPFRDDFQLRFCPTKEYGKFFEENTLYYDPQHRRWTVYICKSKNVGHGPKKIAPMTYPLSEELSRLVNNYMVANGFPSYPFGTKSHTMLIGKILTQLGLKEDKRSINLIRVATANSAANTKDPIKIADMARRSLHSVSVAKQLYENNLSIN